jgi:hypothetical protein
MRMVSGAVCMRPERTSSLRPLLVAAALCICLVPAEARIQGAEGKLQLHTVSHGTISTSSVGKEKAGTPTDFFNDYFVPKGGFKDPSGEQAACLLDKADHIMQIMRCAQKVHPVGDCSTNFISDLLPALADCCAGNELKRKWSQGKLDDSVKDLCTSRIAKVYLSVKQQLLPGWITCEAAGGTGSPERAKCRKPLFHTARLAFVSILHAARYTFKDDKLRRQDATPGAILTLKACKHEDQDMSVQVYRP